MKTFDFTDAVKKAIGDVREFDRVIGIQNRVIDEQWRLAVQRIGWHLLNQGDTSDVAQFDHAIVIGVGLYSQADLDALDSLYMKVRNTRTETFVFSVTDCPSLEQLARFMPGVTRALQTPVVAEYKRGLLVHSCQGKEAREWMGAS